MKITTFYILKGSISFVCGCLFVESNRNIRGSRWFIYAHSNCSSFFLSILQEIERALPSAPSPDPKHQLRRTSSAPLWWLHCKLVPTKLPCTPIILVCNIYVWHSSFQHLENYFSLGSAAIYSPQQCPLVRVFPICTFYKPHFQPTNHYKYALV